MYKQTPKFRKKLNQNQIEILKLLYRFRFASRDLIAEYLNRKDVYRQLLVLEDRQFIGRRYEPSYRLAGRSAAYYLKPDGVRELKGVDGSLDEAIIKKLYSAKHASEDFIDHCITVLYINLRLKRMHPSVKFFTRIDLEKNEYSYFPSHLPDAYVRTDTQHYFLNYANSSMPFFAIVRRLKLLIDYYDNGEWDDTGTDFPVILIILEDERLLKKLMKYVDVNMLNLIIYIKTRRNFSDQTSAII